MIETNPEKIYEFLYRGVETILPSRDFVESQLLSGKKLTMYLGIDPTGPNLHIGHAIALKKLAQFQNLGHRVILLMGDFTARIGDPTDKLATRKTLTTEEIAENLKNYKEQASKIISFNGTNAAEIKFNSEWLGKMDFADVLQLGSKMTVQQMLERDMFQKRIEEGKPIYVHEFMYPLMQGQDSVAMMVDGEIGGNDQLFNMLMGRELLKEHGKEKFVVTVKLLTDPTGKKMGKSEGNMITLDDSADDMFGKIMSWSDGMIIGGFELCTDIPREQILEIELAIQNGENPMQFKKQLAREIITTYHSADQAIDAQNNWENTFSEGGLPDVIPEINGEIETLLSEVLVANSILDSKGEFRRLTDEGGVKIISEDLSETKITDFQYKLENTVVLKIGKKKFVKIIIN
jgi:tyrosyl-tRNA synthetase